MTKGIPVITLIEELKISKSEVNEGLNKFNIELVLLECDYVYVDQQYSKIIFKLMIDDLFDFDKLLWYNEEEKISDIFIKVIIRVVEHKFIISEHDSDETSEFIKQYKVKETLDRIQEYMLEENLLDEYQENIVSHETIYSLLGLSKSNE